VIRNGHAGFGRGSRKRTARHLAEALPQPIRPAIRHARSRRATGECVAAAGRPPPHGTARATPTRTANAAIPARLRRDGPGNRFAKRCAHGEHATAQRRPPTTGRAPTHAGAAAKRSNESKPENGPRRPLSSICTGPGRRPWRTPSAAAGRSRVNAVDIRTRAGARPPVTGAATVAVTLLPLRPSGGATPRARGRLSAAVRRTEAQIPGPPAVTATPSARLSQPVA
jgi:hypothetical protein